jgi:hypothetical protein
MTTGANALPTASGRAYVTKIDGAPGAGKTYTLREALAKEVDAGLGITDFWWLNFSRSGREDVEPEIVEVFAGTDTDTDVDTNRSNSRPADRAKTLHGLALSLTFREGLLDPETWDEQLTQPGKNINGNDPYADFCHRHGMRYDPDQADPEAILEGRAAGTHTGNQLFAIHNYLTQTCKPPEQWRAAGVTIGIDDERVRDLLRAWWAFKADPPNPYEHPLIEHSDYINLAASRGLVPTVDVLLIDEFQDFPAAEYRLYKLWRDSGGIDRIYIAGDPNQSLYSFRGGTPYYFHETDVDEVIELKESRRCRQSIAAFGNEVLSAHPQTDPRGFSGRDDGGSVRWRSIRDKYPLRDSIIESVETYRGSPTLLLLTRTNYQAYRLMQDLRKAGIPFNTLGQASGVWSDELRGMLAFLNNLDSDGQVFAMDHITYILARLPDGDDRRVHIDEQRRRNLDGPDARVVGRDLVASAFDDFNSAMGLLHRLQIAGWKRELLANALDAPASIDVSDVCVGTIHASKGLEAPAVYLFATSSDTMQQRYNRDPQTAAEEHRVYYVGATRASDDLHLLTEYFDGPIAPPIDQVRRRRVVRA